MKRVKLLLVFLSVVLISGCSQRYSLERQLWGLERKVDKAVADPNQMVEGQLNILLKEAQSLESSAKERGLAPRALRIEAILLAALGKNREAIALGDKLETQKDKVAFYNALSKWFLRKKDYNNALSCFEKGLAPVKGSILYYKGLTDMYIVAKSAGKGDKYYSIAEAEYKKAIDSDKEALKYVGMTGLVRLYLASGKVNDAMDILSEISSDGKYPEKVRARAFLDRILLLLKNKNIDGAKQILEQIKSAGLKPEFVNQVSALIDKAQGAQTKSGS